MKHLRWEVPSRYESRGGMASSNGDMLLLLFDAASRSAARAILSFLILFCDLLRGGNTPALKLVATAHLERE